MQEESTDGGDQSWQSGDDSGDDDGVHGDIYLMTGTQQFVIAVMSGVPALLAAFLHSVLTKQKLNDRIDDNESKINAIAGKTES